MKMGMSFLGIIVVAAIALLVVAAIVVLIVALTSRKKDDVELSPIEDNSLMGDQKSYFDGSFFGYIGRNILYYLISVFSLGIAVPWAMCMMYKWEISHTVINGRRLKFTGTGAQLFGKYLLGALLSVITFGIYGIWFGLSIEKWKVSHTVYADSPKEKASRFTGGAGGWFAYNLLSAVLTVCTFGIGRPFAIVILKRWKIQNTIIGGSPLKFEGSGGRLFGNMLLWGLLSCVTFGIFRLFVPVKYLRWEKAYTYALYRTSEYKKFAREQEKFANERFSVYGLAANNTELDKLRSGIKGDESADQISTMAQNGNIYAMFDEACALIRRDGAQNQQAMEMLRMSAYGGYHQAMFTYAEYVKSYNEQEYVEMLKGAAKAGNRGATRLLKEYYENLAYEYKNNNDDRCIDALREASYWFKVAILQGNYPIGEVTEIEYEKMLEKTALWKAENTKPRKGGAGIVIGAIMGVIALLCVLGVGVFMVMAVFGLNAVKAPVSVGEPMPYDELTEYENYESGDVVIEEGQIYSMLGLSEHEATALLNQEGFSFTINYTETTGYEAGTVISSSHSEGFYSKDDTIVLEIAVAPQYPELTESEAWLLVERCHNATAFLDNYFASKGLTQFDGYELPVFEDMQTVKCSHVSGINTCNDLRGKLNEDFTYNFIDTKFMNQTYHNSFADVAVMGGGWIETEGTVYFIPNYGMGFYEMDRDTLTIEETEPGRYTVTCNGGLPDGEPYGAPTTYIMVYENDGYKVDMCY